MAVINLPLIFPSWIINFPGKPGPLLLTFSAPALAVRPSMLFSEYVFI
jgi:hypothetical protein